MGHWLLALQEEAAQAVADRARREVTKRTIVWELLFYVLCTLVLGMWQGGYVRLNETTECTMKGEGEFGGIGIKSPQTNERTVG